MKSKLSRRQFLATATSTAAASSLVGPAFLTGAAKPALAADETPVSVSREADVAPPIIVANAGYQLLLDANKGGIVSFQSTFGMNRDLLISDHAALPLFKIEFLNGTEFKTLTSAEAKEVKLTRTGDESEQIVSIGFKRIGDLPVDALVTIRCPANETLTYWNLELNNGTDAWIAHVQFPVIEVPFDDPRSENTSHILWSFADGALEGPVVPSMQVGAWGGHRH
ncbi:MAG TPA: hypothetical protein VEZ90_09980, partial [Blastocatellia bacterium]|nr:hypothetical protein [Blastocatellia bacterium]